jgi:SIR2-like domain
MHGCVSQPDSIVLTRESYIRYDYQWAALQGIVQATLLTQHLVFVGFSLADDNFLRILDGVRRIARPAQQVTRALGAFGTVLTTDLPSVRQHLFTGDLEWISTSAMNNGTAPANVAAAARQMEIFFDYLGSKLRTTPYLLNERYDSLLTTAERRLRAGLMELYPILDTLGAQGSPVVPVVEQLLRRLGRRNSPEQIG